MSTLLLTIEQTNELMHRIALNSKRVDQKRKLLVAFRFPEGDATEAEDSSKRPRVRTLSHPNGFGDFLAKQTPEKLSSLDSSGITTIKNTDFEKAHKMKVPIDVLSDRSKFIHAITQFLENRAQVHPYDHNPNYPKQTIDAWTTFFKLNQDRVLGDNPPQEIWLVDYIQNEPQLVYPIHVMKSFLKDVHGYNEENWNALQGKDLKIMCTRINPETAETESYKLGNWGNSDTRAFGNIYLKDQNDTSSGKYGNCSLTVINSGEFIYEPDINDHVEKSHGSKRRRLTTLSHVDTMMEVAATPPLSQVDQD